MESHLSLSCLKSNHTATTADLLLLTPSTTEGRHPALFPLPLRGRQYFSKMFTMMSSLPHAPPQSGPDTPHKDGVYVSSPWLLAGACDDSNQ